MAYMKMGCFGFSVRFLVILINLIFFAMSFVVFVLAAVLKWGRSYLNRFSEIKQVGSLVHLGEVESITTAVLVVGIFGMTLSSLGLCGTRLANKCFLVLYESFILMLFIIQGVSILVLLFSSSTIENKYRTNLRDTIQDINAHNSSSFNVSCPLSEALSGLFDCCGYSNASDFLPGYAARCCYNNTAVFSVGCADKVVNDLSHNANSFIFAPSLVLLIIELFSMIMVPFLIGRIGQHDDDEDLPYMRTYYR